MILDDLLCNILKVASYSFLTASELVSKSRDGASFKKSTRKSRAMKCNKLLTNMASKFVKKNFWNSCASLFQFQNIYRMNTRRCSSEKTTRFAMVVTRITRMGKNSFLPHVFTIFGVVCGGNTKENFITKHVS